MSAGRVWEPERAAAARVLALAGWRPSALAHLFNVDVGTASVWARSSQGKPRSKARLNGLVRRLHSAGWQRPQIAQHVGISRATVSRILAGVPAAKSHVRTPSKADRTCTEVA